MDKRKVTILTLLATFCILFAGCVQDEKHSTGYGTMNIRLSADPSMIEMGNSPATRAGNVPDVSAFALSLSDEKAEVKRWDSYADFKDEEKIAIGNYTLKAYYGDEKQEGFDAPYYEGNTGIQILENQNTSAEITCYIANVQLTVICSEAVLTYFSTFDMQVRSGSGTTIDIAKDERRPVYLMPGSLQLEAKMKKQNGVSQTLRLMDIDDTQPRQHYIIRVDVNGGNTGGGTLSVTYNTVQSEEEVQIDLSDASLNLKAPEFTAQGFDDGANITLREGSQPASMKVTLNARAGIRECDLLIQSPYLNSETIGIDGVVKLVPTTDAAIAMKRKVVDKGLRLLGLEDNIERLALIDFTQLVMNMVCTGSTDESSTFTLRAVDNRGVVQEKELSFTTTLQSNQFSLPAITKTVMIGSTEAEAEVNLLTSGDTGEQDVNNVVFEYKDEAGEWIKATTEWVSDNAEDAKNHTAKIKGLPEVHRNLAIRARYGSKVSEEQTLGYYIPEFSITADEADIWARKATMQVTADTPEELNAVLKYLKLTYNGSEIETTQKENTYLWTELQPGTGYDIVGICNEGGEVTNQVTYHLDTEIAAQLPNHDFEGEWVSGPYDGQSINKGGPWARRTGGVSWGNGAWTTKETYESTTLYIKEPKGWCTVNSKTMPTSPATSNTWYVVPSTNQSTLTSTCVMLQNVSWNDNGTPISPIGRIGTAISSANSYESFPGFDKLNSPGIELNRSAGRLFLGSYSYENGTDIPTEGYAFNTRPSRLQFKYKYIPKARVGSTQEDKGYVRIMLRKGTKSILRDNKEFIELDLEKTDNVLTKTLDIPYPSAGCEKPDTICVMFCSSIGGKEWLTSGEDINNPLVTNPNSIAQACVTGSELYIDDIELIY